MNKYILILIITISLSIQEVHAQNYTTITYYKNDSLELKLDLFVPSNRIDQKYPLLLFVHGGGFSGGDRTSGHELCKYAAQNGFMAASVSYTLYMKDKNFSCEGVLSEKIKAIQIAVNQLWQATIFFIRNHEKCNIDPGKIFISGSSAGAETVLHAAFWNRNTMSLYTEKLPETFKYAAVVSGAGALMDLNLITGKTLLPVLVFHGTCDTLVPYGTAPHHYCNTNASGWLMLFGSYSIYNYILNLGGSCQLVTFCGGGHEFAGELFDNNQQPIIDFLNQVIAGKKIQQHTILSTDKTCERSSSYTFCNPSWKN